MSLISFFRNLSKNPSVTSQDNTTWDVDYHAINKPVPQNAAMFGLTIIDWDYKFRKRLKKYTTEDLQIPFQYIEQVPMWEKSAGWNDVGDIMGRFEPLTVYASSMPQELSLSLIYIAEAKTKSSNADGTIRTPWTLDEIDKYTRRLQSLVYPMYDGKYSAPPKLKLNIGSIYIDVPVIVKQVQYTPEAPFDIETLSPLTRKIQLQLRIAYPTWQGISATTVYKSNDNRVFAYRELPQ